MKPEDKLALIVDCENEIAELKNRIDKPYANRHPGHAKYLYSMLKRQEIALLALTAPPAPVMQPVKFSAAPLAAPCEWVYIRFTDTSKNQRMKCQVAWSDWLNSVIYDEEGAPLLISNSAFEVIRAAGYPVEGE